MKRRTRSEQILIMWGKIQQMIQYFPVSTNEVPGRITAKIEAVYALSGWVFATLVGNRFSLNLKSNFAAFIILI